MHSIVALHIETTGLDPEKDAIIEIGAVRFKNRRVEGEWSTLINPGKPIPPFITNLTNITDQMVVKAPMIDDVLDDLARFVGKSPVLNHNVRFDISFFKRFRLFRLNETIDTYELASVLLPGASRYNLGALAQDLGIPYMAKHRGLDDAYTAMGVYLRLYEEVQALPTPLLAEIVRLGEQVEWGANWTLREVLRDRGHEVISSDKLRLANQSPIYTKIAAHLPAPLQAIGEPVALDPDEVTALIDQGSSVWQNVQSHTTFSGFE